jgi:hypothetical protein
MSDAPTFEIEETRRYETDIPQGKLDYLKQKTGKTDPEEAVSAAKMEGLVDETTPIEKLLSAEVSADLIEDDSE